MSSTQSPFGANSSAKRKLEDLGSGSATAENSSATPVKKATTTVHLRVEISRLPKQSIGLVLKGSDKAFVIEIAPGGLGDGKFQIGDQIIRINGQTVPAAKSIDVAKHLISTGGNHISFDVLRKTEVPVASTSSASTPVASVPANSQTSQNVQPRNSVAASRPVQKKIPNPGPNQQSQAPTLGRAHTALQTAVPTPSKPQLTQPLIAKPFPSKPVYHPPPNISQASLNHQQFSTLNDLVRQGFRRPDAYQALIKCNWNIRAAMGQLVNVLEEEEFQKQLRIASMLSEESKRKDEEMRKQYERDTLLSESNLCGLFPKSLLIGQCSGATKLRSYASDIPMDPDDKYKLIFTKLLQYEAKAVKWYAHPAECYIRDVGDRLEHSMQEVDGASTVNFQVLEEETKKLEDVLFGMPECTGGVPLLFLKAEKTLKVIVDEDTGAEIIELED